MSGDENSKPESLPAYYIAFDTREAPGKIKAVRVRLDTEYLSVDSERQLRIDLANDPLYAALESYVHSNPSEPVPEHKKNGHGK